MIYTSRPRDSRVAGVAGSDLPAKVEFNNADHINKCQVRAAAEAVVFSQVGIRVAARAIRGRIVYEGYALKCEISSLGDGDTRQPVFLTKHGKAKIKGSEDEKKDRDSTIRTIRSKQIVGRQSHI